MLTKQINILANTELLLTSKSPEQWLAWVEQNNQKNIFFGIGLMTATSLSEAVPFDILGMFFVAELLRKMLSSHKVIILVADQHAITNNLVPLEKIITTTQTTLQTLNSIIAGFDLTHFEVMLTTPLNFNEDIKKIYRSLPPISNDYLKHEIADTLWLQQHHQVGVKLGWAMNTDQLVQGHDERFFDTQISEFTSEVSFVHTKPGRTGNVQRQRVSPYVSIAGEERIILTAHENAVAKIHAWRNNSTNPAIKPLLRHLSQIIRLHDRVLSPLPFMPLEEKVQTLISTSIKVINSVQ